MSPSPGSRLAALCALLGGCGELDYRYGDLELDIEAPVPADAETLRLCIDGFGATTTGAGNGRAAVTGLGVDRDYSMFLDVLDADGVILATAGPASLSADVPFTTTPLLGAATDPCTADGSPAPQGADSWLLVIRFDETGTPWDDP